MAKTLIKPRYTPKDKLKLQTEIPKDSTSTNLPSNLQNL